MKINTGTMTVGIFAVLFGLVGAYALRAALVEKQAPPMPQIRTVSVPLAGADLPTDRKIALGDIALMPMTHEQMRERGYNLETTMLSTEQIVGRYLQEPVKQGQPFATTALYPEGSVPNPARRLQAGYRAMTVPISDLGAVGGAISAGSMVDVLFRATAQPANDAANRSAIPEATVTLLEGVEVIGLTYREVGRDARTGLDIRTANRAVTTDSLEAVTLAVTPKQANVLKTIDGRGELWLALRGEGASGSSPTSPMTLNDLLGIAPPPKPQTTVIFRGTSRQEMQFDDQGISDESFGGIPMPVDRGADHRAIDAQRGAHRPQVETTDAR